MNLIRKFFDAAVAEPAGNVSVAHLMATQGVKVEPGSNVEVPAVTIQQEKKEEPKPATEPTPAATATVDKPAETATPEPPKPATETAVVPNPQKVEEPKPIQSWQEVLKSQQPDTVLKELGYDDKSVQLLNKVKSFDPKVLGLIQAYEEGRHVDYLKELTTDYSKLSAEEVMRHQIRKEYPKASDKALQAIYDEEVTDRYKLNSEDPDELEKGKLLLDAKAERYRDDFISNQEKYLIPKAPEPKAAQPDPQVEADKKQFEVYRSQFSENQYTKDIFANKKFTIGEGEEKFTTDADPEAIQATLYSGSRWMEKTSIVTTNPDGTKVFTPDVKKQFLIGMVAEYGEDFLKEYANHFKTLGSKKVVDTIENVKPPDNNNSSQSQKAPETVAEAMARQGKVNYGGYQ